MKITIITGIMAASMFLVGCGKKTVSSENSSATPKSQPDVATSSPATQTDSTPQEAQKPPSDDELRQKVIGVWKYSHTLLGRTNDETYTFAPDGNYTKQILTTHGTEKKNGSAFGTWQVKDGFLITIAKKIDPMPKGAVGGDIGKGLTSGAFNSQHKIVAVNEHELVFEVDVYTITGKGGHSKTKGTMKWTRYTSAVP
jgi:hypothetical protein